MIRFYTLMLLSLISSSTAGQILISEISANKGFNDELGEATDWIELLNTGDEAVDLGGYALSDEANNWNEWVFPSKVLAPGERLLILASGQDKPYLAEPWELAAIDTDVWKYLTPSSNPSSNWNDTDYDDSAWNVGNGGFGYGDGDDGTNLTNVTSVYMRKTFLVNDPSDLGYLSMAMDYDDGFIAYLNGTEIWRSESMVGIAGQYDDLAGFNSEAVLYAGGQPEQKWWNEEDIEAMLQTGPNVLAIQAHNVATTSSDMSARPFLGMTAKDGNPMGFASPPFWWSAPMSWFHTSFQLSVGEPLILSNPNGELIDVAPIDPLLRSGLSMGRAEGGSLDWCIFDTPSPGESNAGSTCYVGIEAPPVFQAPSGWYENELTVSVMPTGTDQIIRYTTNGDVPNDTDPIFPTDNLNLSATSVVSTRAWNATETTLPSVVSDATYIIDEFYPDVPTISLITDYDNLWDYNTGIYVEGPNAENNYPFFGANFWQPWSKPTRLQLFDATGTLQAEESLDLEIHGGWSRAEPQRSFRLDFKGSFSGDLNYPLFDEKPEILSFNNINLRNGGQHSWATKLQDAALCRMALSTHNMAGAWEPIIVYLNGEFWGLYGAREKMDEHFVADNLGVNADGVDLMNSWGVLNGSDASFYSAINELMAAPTSNGQYLNLFANHFDVENYIDYFVFETYAQNTDWMGIAWGTNNVKLFRASPIAKWKYILYDNDASFGFFGASYWENFIEYARNPGYPSAHSELFDRVLDNQAFRFRFINRYADLVNTTFQTAQFNGVISAMMDEIETSMPHHIDRWNSPDSYNTWLNAINNMTTHNANRIGTARSHINTSFGLQGQIECTLDVFPPNAGHVRISTIAPEPLPWSGIYFKGCPVEIEAVAATGWIFDHWDENDHTALGEMSSLLASNVVDLQEDDLFRARFEPCPTNGTASIEANDLTLSVATTEIPFVDSIGWFWNDVWIGTGMTFEAGEAGFYGATVYFDGCSVSSESVWTGSVFIEEWNATTDINLSPNPAQNQVTVRTHHAAIAIHDALGRLLFQSSTPNSQSAKNQWSINTEGWPRGTYSVRTETSFELLVIER